MERMRKLTFCSRYFWFTVIMAAVFLLSKYPSSVKASYQSGYGNCFYIHRFLRWGFENQTADITLPAILGIPYICWVYEEILGKRYYISVIKEGKRSVYAGKIVLYAVLSGMLAAILALMLSFLISVAYAIMLLKGDITFGYMVSTGWDAEIPALYAEFQRNGYGWIGVLLRCIYFSFYGGLWPLIGATSVIWLKNRYISAAMPFMLNLVLEFCCSHWIFYPKSMMASVWLEQTKGAGIFCMAAIVIAYCGACYFLIRKGIGYLTA